MKKLKKKNMKASDQMEEMAENGAKDNESKEPNTPLAAALKNKATLSSIADTMQSRMQGMKGSKEDAKDKAMDKKKHIKEGSKKDEMMDAKRMKKMKMKKKGSMASIFG